MITNRNPASTMNDSTAITLAPVNGGLRKNRSSSSAGVAAAPFHAGERQSRGQ